MKNDQRNIYFLELLIEPMSKKVNLNISMDDIIGKFEDCLTNSNNTCAINKGCLLYTSPSPRDGLLSRMPSSA